MSTQANTESDPHRYAWCGGKHRQMYGKPGASPQACINTLPGERDELESTLREKEAELANTNIAYDAAVEGHGACEALHRSALAAALAREAKLREAIEVHLTGEAEGHNGLSAALATTPPKEEE